LSDAVHGAGLTAPAAGWYPDPAAPGLQRWWDGAAWGTAVQAAPTPARALVPATASQPHVLPAIAVGRARRQPPSQTTVIVVVGVVVLMVASAFWSVTRHSAHVTVSASPPTSSDSGTAPGSPSVGVHADAAKMAAAEATVFTRDHRYVQVGHPSANLFINDVGVQMSDGDTVTVGVRANGKGFCARVTGNGATAVYISDKGGSQPASVTVCPANYPATF
jgi:hypothetical protein